MTKTYNDALEWAAQWIEDTLRNGPETNERTIEFGRNVAMTFRAAKLSDADLPRATAEAAWQPIETAPKGRKLIVGYFNPLGKWRSVMGRYYLEGTLESDTDESGYAPEGWYEETEAYEYLAPMDQEPTHWQPLQTPPLVQVPRHE